MKTSLGCKVEVDFVCLFVCFGRGSSGDIHKGRGWREMARLSGLIKSSILQQFSKARLGWYRCICAGNGLGFFNVLFCFISNPFFKGSALCDLKVKCFQIPYWAS